MVCVVDLSFYYMSADVVCKTQFSPIENEVDNVLCFENVATIRAGHFRFFFKNKK